MTSSTAAADSCVRIRIVDDQASVRDSLAFMLRQEGFQKRLLTQCFQGLAFTTAD